MIFVCRAEGPGCTEAETQGCLEKLGAGLSGQAWAAARALTHKHPRCVNAWHCQGAAAFLSGYAEAAVDAYRQAVELEPESAVFWANLGVGLERQGALHDAAYALQRSIELDASMQHSRSLLSQALLTLDRADDSLAVLEPRARLPLTANSTDGQVELRTQLVTVLEHIGRRSDAERLLVGASQHIPGLRLRLLSALVPIIPKSAASVERSRSRLMAAALTLLEDCNERDLDPRVPALRAMGPFALNAAYHGLNDAPLRALLQRLVTNLYPELDFVSLPLLARQPRFALSDLLLNANDNDNDDDSSLPVLSSSQRPFPPWKRRVRVGFVTSYLHQHSVSKMTARLIRELPRTLFHIIVFWVPSAEDAVLRSIQRDTDEFVRLEGGPGDGSTLDGRRQVIVDRQCDVLVYPELGMNPGVLLLAQSRLAPIQVTSHGHSLTSGLADTMDFFVSLDPVESGPADSHYTEQLVRLDAFHSAFSATAAVPDDWNDAQSSANGTAGNTAGNTAGDTAGAAGGHVGVDWEPLASQARAIVDLLPENDTVRAKLGIPRSDAVSLEQSMIAGVDLFRVFQQFEVPLCRQETPSTVRYLCPQSLFKLHPTFDRVLISLLVNDPCGTIGLVEGDSREWTTQVAVRLAKALWDSLLARRADRPKWERALVWRRLLQRLLVEPQRAHGAYLRLLARAPVVVDTFPFGGCTSTMEALLMGTPVVTWPSQRLSGRFSKGMLERLNRTVWVVDSAEELVQRAIEVAQERVSQSPAKRRMAQLALAEETRLAAQEARAIHEWSRFLERVVTNTALAHRGSATGDDRPWGRLPSSARSLWVAPTAVRLGWQSWSVRPIAAAEASLNAAVMLRGAAVDLVGFVCVSIDTSAPQCADQGSIERSDSFLATEPQGRWPVSSRGLRPGMHSIRVHALERLPSGGRLMGSLRREFTVRPDGEQA